MSKLTSGVSMSRLAVPTPGRVRRAGSPSPAKRGRQGSVDLEAGLQVKKTRTGAESVVSNLSKSKSMMNIAGLPGASGGARTASTGGVKNVSTGGAKAVATGGVKAATTGGIKAATTGTGGVKISASGGARPKIAASIEAKLTRQTGGSTLVDRANRSAAPVTAPKAAGGKRPAWDFKGKMEDMERKYELTNERLEALEAEKTELQGKVEDEVVVKTSAEIRELERAIGRSEELIGSLMASLEDKTEKHEQEKVRLKRALEDEEVHKSRLERNLAALQDELACKQTEVSGLKVSVADLSSSRASVELELAGIGHQLKAARSQCVALSLECEAKSQALAEVQENQKKQRAKMRWEETERRKLHNIIQELKGNIRVFCRVRPLVGVEKQAGAEIRHICIKEEDGTLELYKTKDATASSIAGGLNKDMKYDFEFDKVFGPSASQAAVFSELSQLVQSALDGYNVCVFAYGQTGSGKTFTMEGGEEEMEEQAGMIPRTIHQIFEAKEQLKEKSWVYRLHASFLEIYNEDIRDLLATEKDLKYEIKGAADTTVTNLKVEEVMSEARVAVLLKRAAKLRAQAKTLCNERSSRSHSVFILKIEGTNTETGEVCCGALNMVDLAGSERIKESGSSSGMRLKEAQAINNSLANLGNVIMALAQKSSHVPYRNSKLTHLLQTSLGGNSKTLMFVNISPKEECFGETLNSLRFAVKVNQCNIGTAQKRMK